MTNPQDLKTIGLTPFSYHANDPLFRINAGVPVTEALYHASDLLHLAKLLASDAAMVRDSDRHAWASHFLQDMSKAIIDDVVKVLDAPCNNRAGMKKPRVSFETRGFSDIRRCDQTTASRSTISGNFSTSLISKAA